MDRREKIITPLAALAALAALACVTAVAEPPPPPQPTPPDLVVPPTDWVWIGTDFHTFNLHDKAPSTVTDSGSSMANVYIDRHSLLCYRQDKKFPVGTKLALEFSQKVAFASIFGYTSPSKNPPVEPNVDIQNLYHGKSVGAAALQVKTGERAWTYYLSYGLLGHVCPDGEPGLIPLQKPGATAWCRQPVQADCLSCHNDATHGTTDQVFTQFFPALTAPSEFQPRADGRMECDY